MKVLDNQKRKELKLVQRQWMKYRDSKCGFDYGLTGGTMDLVIGDGCLVDMTAKRADEHHRLAQKDCDARWTKKNDRTEYGYKNHIASDQKTKLITDYEVTPASTHDSQVIEKLIDETHKVCYADSAYHSEEIERYLESLNVTSKVIKRKFRNKPLSQTDHKENYKHSKTRVRVEHIFGAMSTQMHKALTLTSIGMKRISSSVGLINLLYNMLRYEQLVRLKGVRRI
jgi:IS5 family transposase